MTVRSLKFFTQTYQAALLRLSCWSFPSIEERLYIVLLAQLRTNNCKFWIGYVLLFLLDYCTVLLSFLNTQEATVTQKNLMENSARQHLISSQFYFLFLPFIYQKSSRGLAILVPAVSTSFSLGVCTFGVQAFQLRSLILATHKFVPLS